MTDDQTPEPEIELELGDILYYEMSFTLRNPWPTELLGPEETWTAL